VAKFEKVYPLGTGERIAMLYLGVRRSDAVLLGSQHEDVDGTQITFQVYKGRNQSVKILALPILPPLREVLDAGPIGGETYLTLLKGRPHADGNSFGNWFCRVCRAMRCAEAGATEHDMMALFGWDTPEMARVYTRAAAQKRMALSAARKMNGQK
jgi:integrase